MTNTDLAAFRHQLGFTQFQMALRMHLSTRAYHALEKGESPLGKRHIGIVERVGLAEAVSKGNPLLAPPIIRKEALALASLMLENARTPV